MKKGFTVFITVIVVVCLISMISVSANDTGYGQFGRIYFGATSDEATFDEASFDEASFDEASFDEASPDEWWAYTDIYEISAKKYYLESSSSGFSNSDDMKNVVKKTASKKAVLKKNTVAPDDSKSASNTNVTKAKEIKKLGKNIPEIKKTNTKSLTKTANTAPTPQNPNYIGWILMGVSIAGIVAVLILANKKQKNRR